MDAPTVNHDSDSEIDYEAENGTEESEESEDESEDDTAAWEDFKQLEKLGKGDDWKAVVIGNPSGKMRRMSILELGELSRWTEIRKLNFLIKGPLLGDDTEKRGLAKHY